MVSYGSLYEIDLLNKFRRKIKIASRSIDKSGLEQEGQTKFLV